MIRVDKKGAWQLALLTLLLGILVPVRGEAREAPPTWFEAAGKFGYGTNPDSRFANPFGVGLGARLGVSFYGLYAGVEAMHYAGGGSPSNYGHGMSASSTLLGGDLGVGGRICNFVARVQLGVGNLSVDRDSFYGGPWSSVYVKPGATALLWFDKLFIGGDAELLAAANMDGPASTTSLALHVQVGFGF